MISPKSGILVSRFGRAESGQGTLSHLKEIHHTRVVDHLAGQGVHDPPLVPRKPLSLSKIGMCNGLRLGRH